MARVLAMIKRIIISGGNFVNKGAEAMLYVTANECFSRFKNSVCCIQLSEGFFEIHSLKELYGLSVSKTQNIKHSGKIKKLKDMIEEYRKAELMIDISGYELCSKLGNYPTLRYIFKLLLCKYAKTKAVLMPQSYGPFDYVGKYGYLILHLINRYLRYPLICFARENKSAEYLKDVAPKAKVIVSADLVLQSETILDAVRPFFKFNEIEIADNSVALVVNRRLYEQYGHDTIFSKYKNIIYALLEKEKNIYLLCHASDDFDICKEIKANFKDSQKVIIVEEVLNCFAFQILARKFEYIVAARYHSIVHAYKECIPCIALGWAVKYQELLELMGQERYVINIGNADDLDIENVINRMDSYYREEQSVIKSRLRKVQKDNCFDVIEARLGEVI